MPESPEEVIIYLRKQNMELRNQVHVLKHNERRDFAGQAMQGLLARSLASEAKHSKCASDIGGLSAAFGMKRLHFPVPNHNKHGDKYESYAEYISREAYLFADAMLANA